MDIVSYPDPEQESGDTQYNSVVLTTINAITNQIRDNKNTSPVVTNFTWIWYDTQNGNEFQCLLGKY